jgi:RNA recognition motif-containing protein
MGSLAGGNLLDRMGPGGLMQSEVDERRGGNPFQLGDRRNQYRMDRCEQDFPRNQFGRDQLNDRGLGRSSTFPGDRFQRDRYPGGDRNFEPRPETRQTISTAVELRNMPIEASYGDIRRFFQGLHITGNGLKLINDNHGNRVGIAYVKFMKREDKEEALKYTGRMMRGSIIEVLHLSDEIFDKAIDSYKPPQEMEPVASIANIPEKKDTEKFVCLSVKDLPPYAKEQNIIKLFQDIPIEEVVMQMNKDDRKQYMAFVKFTKPEDAKKAHFCNTKHTIGHKAVTVAPCSEEEFQEAKENQNAVVQDEPEVKEKVSPDAKEKMQDSKPSPQEPRSHGGTAEQPIRKPLKALHPPTDCVLLKGLPVDANDRDILDFFSDVGLVPLRIHIMLDKFSKPTGDAFCEFSNTEEAARSRTKNNMPLGKQDVMVQAVLREEMNEALGVVSQPDLPIQPLGFTRLQHPRDFSNRSVGLLGVSPSGPLLGRMPLFGRHPGSMPMQSQVTPIEGFGKPGCVVAVENIPFRADIDEILEFFGDFDISRESVIRRFNDKGMATGDARVAFSSPSEAQRAIRELRFRKIRGRPIYLSLL